MAKQTKTFIFKITKQSAKIMILFTIVFAVCGVGSLIMVNRAAAQSGNWWQTAQDGGLNQVGQAYGTDQPRDVREIVVDIIKIILGFLGILAMILVLYAGFKWMTAGGKEEQVSDAKQMLIAGVIGLVIILFAYIIANFVINNIYGAATGQPVLFY